MLRNATILFALSCLALALALIFGPDRDGGGGTSPEGNDGPGPARAGQAQLQSPGGAPGAGDAGDEVVRSAVAVTAGSPQDDSEPAPCAIEGVVVDQNGTPMPGLVLLLDRAAPDPKRPDDRDAWLKSYGLSLKDRIGRLHIWGRHKASTTTDEVGEFRMELPGPERWRLTTHRDAQTADIDIAATGLDLVVEEGVTRRLRIVVHLGRFVHGNVVYADGSPAGLARVWTERREIETVADNDGNFHLGPMVPGRFRLIANALRPDGYSVTGGPEPAETGQPVTIRLRDINLLHGMVVDGAGVGRASQLHARTLDHKDAISHSSKGDGSFVLSELSEGPWRFVARTAEGEFGQTIYDIPPPDTKHTGEIRITVQPGATLRLKNTSAVAIMRYHLLVDGVSVESGRSLSGNTATITIPPEGATLELEALAVDPTKGGFAPTGWNRVHKLEAKPGEVITLDAEPE